MNFKLTKVEATHDNINDEIINRSVFVLLELGFQNPEWKPMTDARFEKFNVSIYINILLLF